MARRAYTSYDVYPGYNTDEPFEDLYPGPIDGVYTPQPMDRCYTPQNGDIPLNGLQGNGRPPTASRPKSVRTPSRASSRAEVRVEDFYNTPPIHTEKKRKPRVSETQYNYAIPDESMRPTSPVQRVLEKWHTQPNMALQGPPPGSNMDPITRQYYHRMWKNQAPANNVVLNRYGRAGGVWRHVRSCVANTGTQIAFIDGIVKEEDNVYFAPWNRSNQIRQPARPASYTQYRTLQPNMLNASYIPVTTTKVSPNKSYMYKNRFNTRAKEGFKYWYQEPKPIDSKKEALARRRIMMGYATKSASMAT